MKRRELLKWLVATPAAVAVGVLPKGSAASGGRWLWSCSRCAFGNWTGAGETPNTYATKCRGHYSGSHRWEFVGDFQVEKDGCVLPRSHTDTSAPSLSPRL